MSEIPEPVAELGFTCLNDELDALDTSGSDTTLAEFFGVRLLEVGERIKLTCRSCVLTCQFKAGRVAAIGYMNELPELTCVNLEPEPDGP